MFDAQGKLIIDAASLNPAAENRGDEEYFQAHRDRADIGLFIGRPMQHHGAYSIVLSRRITGADGGFEGVVAGSIRFSYFHDLFGRLQLGADDTIAVCRHDGTVIMRTPFDLDVIGKDFGHMAGVRRMLAEPNGSFTGAAVADDVQQLEELATTDALTGLKNRRKFATGIELEWRRAARSGTPVALITIDADPFKSYNDTYGHQAGDQVLVDIAICISDAVRRAGDCPSRYGGEEFAVRLPGLSNIEAIRVAETIRLKVEHWSEDPVSTVSIGVASMMPVASLDWSDLVEAADKVLYAAKANGRNQSVLATCRSWRWWLKLRCHSGMVR